MTTYNHAHELFFKPKREKHPDSIRTTNAHTYGMDLKTNLPSQEGYKYFLILVNYVSGHCYTAPLKSKTMGEVTEALAHIIRLNRNTTMGIGTICCDQGSEFVNSEMREFLRKKQINLVVENTTINKNSMGIVERYIGMLTRFILTHLGMETLKNRRQANLWTPLLAEKTQSINEAVAARGPRHLVSEIAHQPPIIHDFVIPIGDPVYIKIREPEQIINGKKKFINFRNGDIRFKHTATPSTVTDYRIRNGRPLRYILDNNERVSYNHHQLLSKTELDALERHRTPTQ